MKTIIISIITLCLAFSLNNAISQTAFHKGNSRNLKTMEVRKCDAYKHDKVKEHKNLVRTHSFCNGKARDVNTARHEENRKKIKEHKRKCK